MSKEKIIDFIGTQKPSIFSYTDKNNITHNIPNHMSYFIIPFPHAVYDAILKKTDSKSEKTNPYKKYKLSDRIDFFLAGMFKKKWKLKNPLFKNSNKLFNCQDIIKRYIYDDMIPHITLYNRDNREKEGFFNNKENLFFQMECKNQWTLKIDEDTNHDVEFTMDGLDLWIMDEHIAFLTLKTKIRIDENLTVNEISSLFNRKMREFRKLNVDFDSNIITYSKDDGNFIQKFLEEKVSIDNCNLLNINVDSLNADKYYTIYNSSFYAKMITAIHIDANKINDDIEIEPSIEPAFDIAEVYDINIMEHCAYLLGSSSDLYPKDDYLNDYGYICNQVHKSGIGIWKYWSGLALADSLSFFGINKNASSGFVESARNENYFIYILNMYISYKIRYFEHELIDKDFTEVEKIKHIKEKLQRLKNEYSSKEIAKRFQANEINISIQKGMGYIEVYEEIESNIDNTLSLSKNRTAEYISVFGLILFFQDELKKLFNEYILKSESGIFFIQSPLELKIIIGIIIVLLLNKYSNKLSKIFKKIGKIIVNFKREHTI